MKKFRKIKYPYLYTWLALVVIVSVTLMPMPEVAQDAGRIPHFDKVVHFVMFGVLATLWWWEYAVSRGLPKMPWRALVWICCSVSAIGALVEVCQHLLGMGRSGDLYDWIADTAGAIIIPALCVRLLDSHLSDGELRLCRLHRPISAMRRMEKIYLASFPPEERREWSEIVRLASARRHPLRFWLLTVGGEPCGFITAWRFKGFRYVEHFAVDSCRRGHGIGAEAMRMFVTRHHTPVVLEVEPAGTSPMAARRIAFYERCGFRPHPEYRYIQPPYSADLPEVPLMLMTASYNSDKLNLHDIDKVLKIKVYNANHFL